MKTIFCLIIFVILSCKENLVKKSDNSEKNIPEKNIPEEVTNKVKEKPNEVQKITSFTISCGSGCAMIYYEKSIASNEVTFRVETYINEVLSEENLETYVIECDQNISPIKVTFKGDVNNILESELPMMQSEFQKYAEYFCSKNTISH